MRRWGSAILVAASLTAGCATVAPAPAATPVRPAYWLPEYLADDDLICVPYRGTPLCRPVREVRELLAAGRA